jgi:hypothetical protein
MLSPEQQLKVVRQAFLLDDTLKQAFLAVVKQFADEELRVGYKTLDVSVLMRQTGIAEGMEKLASVLTKDTVARSQDRLPPR